MNRGHSPEHEVLLAEILATADAATPPELAACPECRNALAGARQMAAHVADAARQEQEILAGAERMDPAAAAEAARRFAARHLAGQGPPPGRSRRPWGWWTGLLLAAAAGVAVLLWPPGTAPDAGALRTGPILLGPDNQIRLDHPVGAVTRYTPFSWQAVDGDGIVYELSIYKEAADGSRTLIRTVPLETTTWDPEAARLVLPERIQWHVLATDAARWQRRQAWASASLTPR